MFTGTHFNAWPGANKPFVVLEVVVVVAQSPTDSPYICQEAALLSIGVGKELKWKEWTHRGKGKIPHVLQNRAFFFADIKNIQGL